MAATPVGRQGQLQRYRRAEVQLADRLARNQERPKDKRLPCKQVRVSLSDPEAPLGRDKEKVFCPLYTAQFVVAPDSLLILSFDVFAQPTDAGTLPPMLDRTAVVTGRMLDQIDTDAGYCSVLDLQACQARGVQLVAPVQENDFTERKRAQAENTQIGKDQFQWLPEEQTYACPKGHRLNYKGRERKRSAGRSDGHPASVSLPGGALPVVPAAHALCPQSREGADGQAVGRGGVDRGAQGVHEHSRGEEGKATPRLGDRTLFRGREAASQSPTIAWTRSEAGQGRGRLGGVGPNRPDPGKTPEKGGNPPGKHHLKAGRSLQGGESRVAPAAHSLPPMPRGGLGGGGVWLSRVRNPCVNPFRSEAVRRDHLAAAPRPESPTRRYSRSNSWRT